MTTHSRSYPSAFGEPVLATEADLDNDRVSDVCIGLPDGPGGRFRVLHRVRAPLREAVRLAGRTAGILAGASSETVLDPQCRPSAIRICDSTEGFRVWLDYDVGVVEGRPRTSRPLRLMMLASRLTEPRPNRQSRLPTGPVPVPVIED